MIKTVINILTRCSLMSWLDRQRGTPKSVEKIPKLMALLGMGYLCAAYTGHLIDWQAVVITAGVAFAHNFGFGEPLGHALTGRGGSTAADGTTYELWQIGKMLKANPWVALTVRGLLVGLWTLWALDPIASLKIAIAFGIAFPLAPHIVRYRLKMPTATSSQAAVAWAQQEKLRGALIELLLLLMLVTTLAVRAIT